jgi:DNA-binding response OmpR family regulator
MTKVLLVEDDLALSDVLVFTLRRAGFEVVPVYDGEAALAAWESQVPELLVLDLNLPKLDGLSVCRRIRASSGPQAATPIIILSVRSADDAIVTGLDVGADDYVVKPFSPTQLVARIRAVLRRAHVPAVAGNLNVSGMLLERSRSQVQVGEAEPVRLTPLEVKLLETLMINAGQVMTVDLLINAVWGQDQGDRAMLKQLVYRLRSKLESVGNQPVPIETIPGVGYVLNVEVAPG